ncbi:deoxyguanosinetriphosphate triphosphohydrolase [Pedosphaera parvula]|uniref:Deoxyguanosinetriphosphate triphosphohydrolase-like protein n=1 Tax=Pedosphaera parvula (strain Ellin514) TaxID=320771 RepID=B9XG79_PEDPL|nr:deoxyguanosinetriphosphate triphosphohydrolase [Pedosphaera parvula]EEF61241.1 deoxyguanosinetriphosphate triphosphohydrolase [Pedosphaera parvula Ellin514]
MPRTRAELEQIEKQTLAPYAQFSADSRGRKYKEAPPEWRTQYQRDRDRVIHSRAFRRLEYKTQVFLNGTGDHLRTRLTHTIEVAAITRNITRALRLNEDLAETIALAHDLGHSPFGHKGEVVLNRLMKKHGGFEHNRHSLRIVEEIEQKYPLFPGLNLSWEVREGLIKHYTSYDHPSKRKGFDAKSSALEAQVANLADEITYYSHDLDDGLDSGLLSEKQLNKDVRIWRQATRTVEKQFGDLADECRRYFIIRCIIDMQVKDVVETTEEKIRRAGVQSADDVRLQSKSLVQYSPERRELNLELRDYLYQNLYYNPVVHGPNLRAVKMLEELFNYYLKHPEQIGDQARKRMRKEGRRRAICDYLAGMTDRYAMQEHERIFGPSP